MKRVIVPAIAALLAVVVVGGTAAAHDLRPGVLALTETAAGEYALRFVPPIDSRGEPTEVAIAFPPGCARTGDRVRCAGEIAGPLAVTGMHGDAMKTLVVLVRRDGRRAEWLVSADAPQITIGGAAPAGGLRWVGIGIQHILGGLDHLAFVIGLLLVLELSLDRRLFWTITAFTLAHSLTLALAVLGLVEVRSAPVEACIAASVLLVAREATHREPTAIRRWPWLAAGAFGLIHGLGFASALKELGLPRASLAWSLVAFNTGVELGQLAVVAVLVLAARLVRRSVDERRILGLQVHRAACYVLGAVAACWLLERVVHLAHGSS